MVVLLETQPSFSPFAEEPLPTGIGGPGHAADSLKIVWLLTEGGRDPNTRSIAAFALFFSRYKSSPNISPCFCQYARAVAADREKGAGREGKRWLPTGIRRRGMNGTRREKVGEMNKGPDTEESKEKYSGRAPLRQALAITV